MRVAYLAAAAMLAAGAAVVYVRNKKQDDDSENFGDEFGIYFNQAREETAELLDNLTGGTMRISAMAKVTDAQVKHKNVQAFLRVIRRGEGTADENGYRRIFGGQLFDSYADHPNIRIYEKKDEFIKNGKKDFTTAAGAYQITGTTWRETKPVMRLKDFSPMSQDWAAVGRIAARGALDDVIAGRFSQAVNKCAREWASLPGSPYGQPVISMLTASSVYAAFGGTVSA